MPQIQPSESITTFGLPRSICVCVRAASCREAIYRFADPHLYGVVAQPGSNISPAIAAMHIHWIEGIDLNWWRGTRIFRELRIGLGAVEQSSMVSD